MKIPIRKKGRIIVKFVPHAKNNFWPRETTVMQILENDLQNVCEGLKFIGKFGGVNFIDVIITRYDVPCVSIIRFNNTIYYKVGFKNV